METDAWELPARYQKVVEERAARATQLAENVDRRAVIVRLCADGQLRRCRQAAYACNSSVLTSPARRSAVLPRPAPGPGGGLESPEVRRRFLGGWSVQGLIDVVD